MPIARRTGEDDLMTEMPHAIAGDKIPEELYRITEAYLREHDMHVIGLQLNADLCNAAIDWWNALQPEQREEPAP